MSKNIYVNSIRDKRYQRKIGFSINLEVALSSVPVIKLLKNQLWKSGGLVKVIATIKESEFHSHKVMNESVSSLIQQIR